MAKDVVAEQLSLFGLKRTKSMIGHDTEISIELHEIASTPKELINYDRS